MGGGRERLGGGDGEFADECGSGLDVEMENIPLAILLLVVSSLFPRSAAKLRDSLSRGDTGGGEERSSATLLEVLLGGSANEIVSGSGSGVMGLTVSPISEMVRL